MKTIQLIILLISITIISTSCEKNKMIRASGNVTEVERSLSNYSKIDVSQAFEVDVTFSATEERIVIEADDNLQEHIVVETVGDVLVIRLANQLSIRGKETMKVHVTTSNINSFKVSGASSIVLNNTLVTNDVEVEMSGASELEGRIEAGTADFDLSGASNAELTGTLNTMNVELSGASVLENYDFTMNRLVADLSGASSLQSTVNDGLEVTASGASQVKYKGTGVVTSQDLSGASTLTKED